MFMSKPVLFSKKARGVLSEKLFNFFYVEERWKTPYKKLLDAVLPLPGPKALGRSDHNALPMREITDEPEGVYTWEDWDAEMQRDYPVAWFMRRRFPRPFQRAWGDVDRAIYKLKCHVLPSYRFHILDLRNPGGGIEWDHGWRDRSEVMLWTCFKMLVDFVENEEPGDMEAHCAGMTAEQVQEMYGDQLTMHREMMSLYRWWKTEREQEHARSHEILASIKDATDRAEKKRIRHEWHAFEEALDATDQKNLERLVAIRGYLWT